MKMRCYCHGGRYKLWEDVRFVMETEEGMNIVDLAAFQEACRQHKRFHLSGDSCIIGIPSTASATALHSTFPLGDNVDITSIPEDTVILAMRVPTGTNERGKTLLNTYIPVTFQKECEERRKMAVLAELEEKLKRTVDEMQRLKVINEITEVQMYGAQDQRCERYRAKQHASRAVMKMSCPGFLNEYMQPVKWCDVPKPVPPEGYVCYRCLNYFAEPPHYIQDCPSHDRPKWVPMNRRSRPIGVPMSRRTAVPWTSDVEAIEQAKFVDSDGNLWNLRQSHCMHR